MFPYVILASASPRRRELLRFLDVQFEVRPSSIEERQSPGELGAQYVARLAREKAEAVARSLPQPPPNAVVLGADTEEMLRRLSGRAHNCVSGVCLIPLSPLERQPLVEVVFTRVHFSAMSESDIAAYVASGEPRDKAGAYAIQGRAARFIERIEGCYYNVMGLPVAAVYNMLRRIEE
jgi:septum formation protein